MNAGITNGVTMELEVKIKKATNGFIVDIQHTVDDEYKEESFVFTRFSQVVKFLREKNLDK